MVVLSFVATLVLIKALFDGFEWGSVTDTLSAVGSLVGAIGTVATFWIAFKAFEKVPDWMAQKHYDVAYTIIENAVFKDLSNVRSLSFQIKTKISSLAKKSREHVIHNKEKSLRVDEMLDAIESNIDEFHRAAYAIINQIKSIERTDYDITSYTENIITKLKDSAEQYNGLYFRIFIAVEEIETRRNADEKAKNIYKNESIEIQDDAISTNEILINSISNVFADNKPIKHFICHKVK